MDIASLAGIILGAVMFVFGVFSNGGFEALKNMVDSASIIITVRFYLRCTGNTQVTGFH